MPVYNSERYVAEAVESILNQTFRDLEFLIIDDGSTDRSLEILKKYEEQDSRIRLISRPNTGYVVALNEMLSLARGNLIARMDADDISYASRFARQFEYLASNRDCVVVGSRVQLIDADGDPLGTWCEEQTHTEIDQAHLGTGWPMVHPAVMMRRDAVDAVGRYRVEYYSIEDRDLFLRLAEVGRVANLPDTLLKYRKHLRSICHTRAVEQAQLQRRLRSETRLRRNLPATEMTPEQEPAPLDGEERAMWAWWALNSGFVRTARKHALQAVRRRPFSINSWRALGCSLRGR